MLIAVILLILILIYYVVNVYLKEYIEVTKVYKTLRKLLSHRDVLVLKILPDIKDEKQKEKLMNLIDDRNKKSNISYEDAMIADVKLNNELKALYTQINKMNKNELQIELFNKIIALEKQIKVVRNKYSIAAEKYNMSLTIHPKVLIKLLHMRPFDTYKKNEN